jgi:hypothetical protein
MGRFMEQYYNNFLNANFPLGIQLGYSDIHWASTEKQTRHVPEYYRAISFRFLFSVTDSGTPLTTFLYQNTALNQYIINSDAATNSMPKPFQIPLFRNQYHNLPQYQLVESTEDRSAFYFQADSETKFT